MFNIDNYINKIKKNKKNKIHENYQYIHIETFKNKNTYNLYIKELLDNFDFEKKIGKIFTVYKNKLFTINLVFNENNECIKSYIYIYK